MCEVVTLESADKLRQNSLHYNKTVCIIIRQSSSKKKLHQNSLHIIKQSASYNKTVCIKINSIKTVYIIVLCSTTTVMILFILPIKTSTNSKEKLFWDFIKSTHKYHHINGINPSRFIPSPICVIMVVIIFVSLTHLLICFCVLQRLLFYLSVCNSCHQICRAAPLCQSLFRQTKIFSQG